VVSRPHGAEPSPVIHGETSRGHGIEALRQQIHDAIAAQRRHVSEPAPRPPAWLSAASAAPPPPLGCDMPQPAVLQEAQVSQAAVQELERLLGRQLLQQLLQGAGYSQQLHNTAPVIGIPATTSSNPVGGQISLGVLRNYIAGRTAAPPARGVLIHNHSAPSVATTQPRGFVNIANVQGTNQPTDLTSLTSNYLVSLINATVCRDHFFCLC
jgi:hypothetical protein